MSIAGRSMAGRSGNAGVSVVFAFPVRGFAGATVLADLIEIKVELCS